MKRSLGVLLAGLLLATAYALGSSNLNLPLMQFGLMGDEDILPLGTPCSDPVGKGTPINFTITDCSTTTYPCIMKRGNNYTATMALKCDAPHPKFQIKVDTVVFFVPVVLLDKQDDTHALCAAGQVVIVSVKFNISPNVPTGDFVITARMSGVEDDGTLGQCEFCYKGKVKVVN